MTSDWGTATFGDPCRECGFEWSVSFEHARHAVAAIPDTYEQTLLGRHGCERHPDLAWTAAGYVLHVADNLRIWSERFVAAATKASPMPVHPYDADALAAARDYEGVSVIAALWSLRGSVDGWLDVTGAATEDPTLFLHPDRGQLTARDVVLTNAHDATHHLWDIERSLAAVDADSDRCS